MPGDIAGRYWLGDLLDRKEPRLLAVLGAPGSGKTTLLRYTVRQVLQSNRRKRAVPILLYLRDHIKTIVSDPTVSLPAIVPKAVGLTEPAGWFEQHLANGDCVVLLDGLDEVARQEERRTVADWVERQTVQYPENDFVLTSRPHGYRTAPISGATVLQVRGFTTKQVIRFVHNWYRMVERSTEDSQDSDQRAASAADDLLERLNDAPQLLDLTVNPLLLTMVANVHRYRGALPGSRVELYSEICQVMLWRRQEAKRLPVELNGEQKERMLRSLALRMMTLQLRDMPRDQVLDELRGSLRRISTKLTAEDLLEDVSSSGLLIEREAQQFSFAHLTFQEYLAATQIRDTGAIELLTKSVDETWWRETAILYSARSTADPIVAACLSSGSIAALTLAFDIAEEGDLAPDLRESLEKILASSADDPEVRRLRNAVLLPRHLRRGLIRTSTGSLVYRSPVSQAVYQLFQGDNADLEESSPPIAGVWADDAVALTGWVNHTTNSEPGYRLVTFEEMEDPVLQEAIDTSVVRHVWTTDPESASPMLWYSEDSKPPHLVTALIQDLYVAEDIKYLTLTLTYLALHLADIPWKNIERHGRQRRRAISFARTSEIFTRQDDYQRQWMRWTQAVNESAWEKHHFSELLAKTDLEMIVNRVDSRYDLNEAILDHMFGSYAIGAISQWRSFRGTLDTDFVGFSLLPYLRRALESDLHRERGVEWFALKFVAENRIASTEIRLDEVADLISAVKQGLKAAPAGETRLAADILAEVALPVFTREQELSDELASRIRVAALALGWEATDVEVVTACRELAAATTLLQLRAKGEAPADEMIMLAII